jgi:hypothetical protein
MLPSVYEAFNVSKSYMIKLLLSGNEIKPDDKVNINDIRDNKIHVIIKVQTTDILKTPTDENKVIDSGFNIETIKHTRLRREIKNFLNNNSGILDLIYDEKKVHNIDIIHIEIPSKQLKITINIQINANYPFIKTLTLKLNNIPYYTNNWPVFRPMDKFIEDVIKNDFEKYDDLTIPIFIQILITGKMIFISQSDTFSDIIKKIFIKFQLNSDTHFISHIKFKKDASIFYMLFYKNKNKKVWDILPKNKELSFDVMLQKFLDADILIKVMKDDYYGHSFIIDNNTLSKSKIVSTFDTVHNLIELVCNLYLHKDNLEYMLFTAFRTKEVKLLFNDEGGTNPAVFYISSYLDEFAEKLKIIPYFNKIQNISEYLLSIITKKTPVKEEDNFNFTLMILLFGDISQNQRNYYKHFILNEDIMKVYDKYISNTDNIVQLHSE